MGIFKILTLAFGLLAAVLWIAFLGLIARDHLHSDVNEKMAVRMGMCVPVCMFMFTLFAILDRLIC